MNFFRLLRSVTVQFSMRHWRPGSLRGNGLTPEKEISLAGLSPLQNTFLAFSLSNIPRFPLGRSITKSYFSFVLSSVCFMDGGLFT